MKLCKISPLWANTLLFAISLLPLASFSETIKPNIIIIMTDDQGYGDLGLNQNPVVKTPNIDKLASESSRFSNFHMDPTCSPSRASLLTGQYSMRAGVWHTIMGRSLLPTEHTTLPEALKTVGYRTAMFGKWHLGDNYPFRPEDQGFDETLIHGGGGVGQTPDYWGNTQFSDTYFRNGKPEYFDDYATNVWFDETINFINKNSDKPFFTYLSTNAPHSPWRAPKPYVKPYLDMGLPKDMALFYAMITHLDEQVGRLRLTLEKAGIADNTLLVFATDNGSSMSSKSNAYFGEAGFNHFFSKITQQPQLKDWKFNAGMRGFKSSVYEGGHRVPLFIHWPNGGIEQSRDFSDLTAHIDVMPTLLEAAQAKLPKGMDGISLLPLMQNKENLKKRTLIVTNQRVDIPSKKRPSVVMTKRWRYVIEQQKQVAELYDIKQDPAQQFNVIKHYPDVVTRLQNEFELWWNSVTEKGFARQRVIVGSDEENPARLTAMDWMEAKSGGEVPWFPGFHRPQDRRYNVSWLGREESFRALPWYLQVERSAEYQVTLYLKDKPASHAISRNFAFLEINGKRLLTPIDKLASGVHFTLPLLKGDITLKGWFADDKKGTENTVPAFYSYIRKL